MRVLCLWQEFRVCKGYAVLPAMRWTIAPLLCRIDDGHGHGRWAAGASTSAAARQPPWQRAQHARPRRAADWPRTGAEQVGLAVAAPVVWCAGSQPAQKLTLLAGMAELSRKAGAGDGSAGMLQGSRWARLLQCAALCSVGEGVQSFITLHVCRAPIQQVTARVSGHNPSPGRAMLWLIGSQRL